jgi:hypothetical protein
MSILTWIESLWHRHHPVWPPPVVPPPVVPPPGNPGMIAQIADDMLGKNESIPQGVPSSYDFYSGPVVEDGNNVGSNKAMVLWGTVYPVVGGSHSTNTRVNIRACNSYWLRKSTGTWLSALRTDAPEVEDYPQNFQGNSTPTNVRHEPDGSISVIPGLNKVSHFYAPYPRISIDPGDFSGVVNYCEMRLILDKPTGIDDRASAKFVGNTGGDYYPYPIGAGIENNPSIAGGKYKNVTEAWRSFAMTTLTAAQLTKNPPPIPLTGIDP